MDPSQIEGVSLVVGAVEGLKDTAKQAVIGARNKLISMLRSHFRNDEDAVADLNVYVRRPTTENAESLAGHIVAAGIDRDEEILSTSRRLLDVAGSTATGAGSVASHIINQINTLGASGFIGGHHVHHHEKANSTPVVDWELFHLHGALFELRNVGTGPAYHVVLNAPGAVRFDPPNADLSEWPRGSGYEFFATGSLQTGHPRLVVRWADSPNESAHKTWERPLPR